MLVTLTLEGQYLGADLAYDSMLCSSRSIIGGGVSGGPPQQYPRLLQRPEAAGLSVYQQLETNGVSRRSEHRTQTRATSAPGRNYTVKSPRARR